MFRLTVEEINSKTNDLTEDDIKKYSQIKQTKSNVKRFDDVAMIAMHVKPKNALQAKVKKLLKRSMSDSR